MPTIVCVLRSGGDYDPSWVLALYRGVREHLSQFDFFCLTDQHFNILGVETIPLQHDFPGWWSKVEIYTPGLFAGPLLYLDLDTLPIGSLEDLGAYTGSFAALSDFYKPSEMASGVLAFTPDDMTAGIYERFLKEPRAIMRKHTGRSDEWYRKVLGKVKRLQKLFPGQIVSLKVHAKYSAPGGACLVAGHGKPRFSDPRAGWVHDYWKKRAR